MEEKTFTVSEINSDIRKKIQRDPNFKNILIKGEISNYSSSLRGHDYFTLKDEKSQIPAVFYKNQKDRFLKFKPENGMNVIIKGSIEVYHKGGKYQLKVATMTEDGVGNLHIAFEQLKKKLNKEGLFEKDHKKEIPTYPKTIGVITAPSGSVIKDIITTIKRRYPICRILLFPTLVQGDNASPQIIRQIRHTQNFDIDTLIIGRGGGSIEDLWPFNEEDVAREIYACKTPTISAVGHETDYTISDFVADLRAPTPTAAAELAVPELNELKNHIHQLTNNAKKSIFNKLSNNKLKFDAICKKSVLKNPENIYLHKEMNLDNLVNTLRFASKNIIKDNKTKLIQLENSYIIKNPQYITKQKKEEYESKINKINHYSNEILRENKNKLFKLENSFILKNPNEIIKRKEKEYSKNYAKLEVLNPLLTLKRGYSIAKSKDKVISSAKDVKSGDELDIEFEDGTINTKVI